MARFIQLFSYALLAWLVLPGCAEEFHGRPPLEGELRFPLGLAVDEANEVLYVVNSNFDLAYESASVLAVDLETHEFLDTSVAVDSFPGDLLIHSRDDGKPGYGYVAVRGDNSVSWFQINPASGSVELTCGLDSRNPGHCEGTHVVTKGLIPSADDELVLEESSIGSDPFALAWIPGNEGEKNFLVVGAMNSGRLSLMEIQDDGTPVLVGQTDLLSGLHSIAVEPDSRVLYVTNKSYPVVHRLEVVRNGSGPSLDIIDALTLPAPFTTSDFARGIAFAENGNKVLVSYRTPSSVIVLDGSAERGTFANSSLKVIPIGGKPGQVRVFPTGPDGQDLAYIPCFNDDVVWVVDPAELLPVDRIKVGFGPYEMAAITNDKYKKGFVSNFLQDTVSVIDLDPSSPYYHQEIAEIH